MMTPVVSVIVPTRNRPDLLREALESVACQDLGPVEVIVVNDGGTPVAEHVRGFSGQLSVRVLDLPESRGPSHARNVGIDLAAGEFVAFLDDDDMYRPDHLSAAVAELRAGDVQIVSSATAIYDRRIRREQIGETPPRSALGFRNALDMLPALCPFTTVSVVCRSLKNTNARFDTALSFCEDWDMWLRLVHGLGFSLGTIDARTAVYFRPATSASATGSAATHEASYRNAYRSYLRVCQRWPVPPLSHTAKLRIQMDLKYAIAFKRLAAGRHLPLFYHEDLAAAFSEHLAGQLTDAGLRRRIYLALDEEPPA
jgi:glycosyltransferase involved in cell wall biosynthesis